MLNLSKQKLDMLREQPPFSTKSRLLLITSSLEEGFKIENKPFHHEKLYIAVKKAHEQSALNHLSQCGFDYCPVACKKFVEKLKHYIYVYCQLNFSYKYLGHLLASALYSTSFTELLATLTLYRKLLKGEWNFNECSLRKPITNKGEFKVGQYITLPEYCEPRGETLQIARLDTEQDCYYLWSRNVDYYITSAFRYWGHTPTEAVIWNVAVRIVRLGPKAWNSLLLSIASYNNGSENKDKWEDSAKRESILKELISV